MTEPELPVAVGHVLDGRYRIESVLGTGGLGVVYRASHVGLGRDVAVKVLHPSFNVEPEIQERFAREARALSTLAHPRIVAVTDFGSADGVAYLAMEMLEGRTLADELEGGALDPGLAVDVILQVLEGLAFAHGRGVIHRDLKPGNVFLAGAPDGPLDVKLLDFGLAKIGDPDDEAPPSPTLTRLGTILGTPSYMSPEQAATHAADARSDIYSAGIVLYEMLAGRPPFRGQNRIDTIRAHLVEDVPPPDTFRPGLSLRPELAAVIERSLAKTREARYSKASDMLDALRAVPRPVATMDKKVARKARPTEMSGEEPTVLAQSGTKRARDAMVADAAKSAAGAERAEGTAKAAQQVRDGKKTARGPRRARIAVTGIVSMIAIAAVAGSVVLYASESEPVAAAGPRGAGEGADDTGEGRSGEGRAERGAAERGPRAAPRDPMAGELPRALRAAARRVGRGRELSRDQIRALRSYQQDHADDPRPSLLLGHDHYTRQWLTASIQRYRIASSIDPSSRGNAWMRDDLVAMAETGSHHRPAAALLAEIYGAEALPAVEAALARDGLDAASRERLERVRARVASD